jgi:hypothetical protein
MLARTNCGLEWCKNVADDEDTPICNVCLLSLQPRTENGSYFLNLFQEENEKSKFEGVDCVPTIAGNWRQSPAGGNCGKVE